MPERAFTIGYRPSYEEGVRIPGNGKAVSGVAFRTREDAQVYLDSNGRDTYGIYEMELPKPYDECVSRDGEVVFLAYHLYHFTEQDISFVPSCPVCTMTPPRGGWALDYDALLVPTRFINPDTGAVA